MEIEKNTKVPIAKAYSIEDLSGWFGKWFHVPDGKQGIILYGDNEYELFPSGKRPVIRPFDRWIEKGTKIRLGYIPLGAFDIPARFSALPCGDSEPIDVSMILLVEVSAPALFFSKIVFPVGELVELPDLEPVSLRKKIGEVLLQYEREDILSKVPVENISTEIIQLVAPLFPQFGLKLLEMSFLVFQRSDHRSIEESKISEIEEKALKTLTNDAELTTRSEMNEVIKKVFPDSVRLDAQKSRHLSEVIDALHQVKRLENRPKQHWMLMALSNKGIDEADDKTQNVLRKWQRMEINWIILLLLIGSGLTYIFYHFGFDLTSGEIIGSLVGIWGLIISLILNSIRKLVDKKETVMLAKNGLAGVNSGKLVGLEMRSEVDKLVRQQCAMELKHVSEILNNSRAKLYDEGQTVLALKIKELEKSLEEKQKKVLDVSNTKPFYLTQMTVTDIEWQRLLDQEELSLQESKVLGLMTEAFQFAIPNVNVEDINKIENQLQVFNDSFYDRSRLS